MLTFALPVLALFNSRMRKLLAAIGLLFVVTLSGVSLAVSHEIAPAAPAHGIALHCGSSYRLPHADRSDLRQGFDCDTCDVRVPLSEASGTVRPLEVPPTARAHSSSFAHSRASKVSLHMLDSILLI